MAKSSLVTSLQSAVAQLLQGGLEPLRGVALATDAQLCFSVVVRCASRTRRTSCHTALKTDRADNCSMAA
jgi:hypothetical protein